MRRKIIALSTLIAVWFAILAPTAALAAPPQRPQQPPRQAQRHNVKREQPRFRSMADQERRVNPKLQQQRDRVTNPGMHQFRPDRGPKPQPRRNEHRGPRPDIRRGEHRGPHHDRLKLPRFEHHGRHYYHGFYRGYWGGRWRTWHSQDWIRTIGLAAFVALILDNRASYLDGSYEYIYDRYGNVVAVIER